MTKPRRAPHTASYLLVMGLAGLMPVAAQAQAQTANEPWKWEAAIYGWFPGMSGSTSFPPVPADPAST